jgi:hypothetical protein
MNENDGHLTPVRKTARTISNPHVTLLASLGTLQRQCVCVCVCVCVWGGEGAGWPRATVLTYTSTHVHEHTRTSASSARRRAHAHRVHAPLTSECVRACVCPTMLSVQGGGGSPQIDLALLTLADHTILHCPSSFSNIAKRLRAFPHAYADPEGGDDAGPPVTRTSTSFWGIEDSLPKAGQHSEL